MSNLKFSHAAFDGTVGESGETICCDIAVTGHANNEAVAQALYWAAVEEKCAQIDAITKIVDQQQPAIRGRNEAAVVGSAKLNDEPVEIKVKVLLFCDAPGYDPTAGAKAIARAAFNNKAQLRKDLKLDTVTVTDVDIR